MSPPVEAAIWLQAKNCLGWLTPAGLDKRKGILRTPGERNDAQRILFRNSVVVGAVAALKMSKGGIVLYGQKREILELFKDRIVSLSLNIGFKVPVNKIYILESPDNQATLVPIPGIYRPGSYSLIPLCTSSSPSRGIPARYITMG